ncbi:MAG: hypothetical protein IPL77_09405 [Flavobacteriales bacterium]|nr:hypothetical protein [Flavobacteriales bacterium]
MPTEIHYKTDGFMLDAAYTADLRKVLNEFVESFPGLAEIHVTLHEKSYPELNYDLPPKPLFSCAGNIGQVHFTSQRYYNAKGKVTSTPTPFDVFQSLRFCMNRAKEQYAIAPPPTNGDRT